LRFSARSYFDFGNILGTSVGKKCFVDELFAVGVGAEIAIGPLFSTEFLGYLLAAVT